MTCYLGMCQSFTTHVPEEQVKVPKHIFSPANEPAQVSAQVIQSFSKLKENI